MSQSTTPSELVRTFCAAWSQRDADAIAAYFADDAIYHNMPMQPVQGRAAITGALRHFLGGASAVDFEILHLVAAGDVVLTERVDRFTLGEKQAVVPVAGVFEVRDGKIAAWRDYFDLAGWTSQLGG
jgi:limonene-1,2-epoxide hydrolase